MVEYEVILLILNINKIIVIVMDEKLYRVVIDWKIYFSLKVDIERIKRVFKSN